MKIWNDKNLLMELNNRQFEKCIAGTISQNRTTIMKPSLVARMEPDDPRNIIKLLKFRYIVYFYTLKYQFLVRLLDNKL